MFNVNAQNQRVFLKQTGDYIYGSALVTGGKDEKGNFKPNGFVNIKFSNACQDAIYDYFKGECDKKEMSCDLTGFLSWNEWNDIKEAVIVVVNVEKISEYAPKLANLITSKPFKKRGE